MEPLPDHSSLPPFPDHFVPNHSSLLPFPVAQVVIADALVTDSKMRPTCFALLALLAVFAAAQNPCALECRRQTCSSLNHSFSCEELSGFGCDCVSRRWVLKPHAHSRSRASHTYRRPRTHRRAAAPTRWLPSRRRRHQRPPSRHPPPSRWL